MLARLISSIFPIPLFDVVVINPPIPGISKPPTVIGLPNPFVFFGGELN